MQKTIIAFFVLVLTNSVSAQKNPLWLRYPAISPDGTTIVFSYQGDLYKVGAEGGNALPLTMHEAHDYQPVWSRDGNKIAFASDRFGNFDVFVISASGGEATRLTYHSSNDYPFDFSIDNSQVLFGSARHTVNTNVRFPRGNLFLQTYTVPVTGGRSVLLSATGMEHAQYNSNGSSIIYQDRKGTEDPWRKHQTSSLTRDVWIFDIKENTYRQLSDYIGEDREPLFSNDDQYVYYLSEKKGSQNIFKRSINGKTETQISFFKDHPVRHLTRSNNNSLCFSWNGEIYTINNDGSPKKVNINISADIKANTEQIVSVNASNGDYAVSPNGKELAFIFRGEVFVTSVDGGITKRITNTPQQERMVDFSKDGKSIFYSTERNGSWDIYKSSIVRKDEAYFYASTILKEEAILATDKEEFQPSISPDGKELAYLEDRNTVRVYNLDNKSSRTILPAGMNFSYADGDQYYKWSLDSKWLAIRSGKGRYGSSEVVMYKVDGSDKTGVDLTQSGFQDGGQLFALEGKALVWATDKYGKRPLAYQGARETDVSIMFFDQDSYDKFRLSKEEYALLKEKDDNIKKDSAWKVNNSIANKQWLPDFKNIDDRKIRLTQNSMVIGSFALSADGSKLWYTATTEKNTDLWELNTRTRETKIITRVSNGAGFISSTDGKSLYLSSAQGFAKLETETGKIAPISIRGEMVLNPAGERAYIFEHAWRQVKKKFYDPNLHGVNWEMYKMAYIKMLPHINNNYDFQELLSEMLGELNASHTGGRFSPQNPTGDQTASLGMFYDEFSGGDGLKITEVITNGPTDLANSKIKAGMIIEKIDGEAITATKDWNQLLNRKAGSNVLLSVLDQTGNTRFEEVVKPINGSAEQALLYNRWVNTMRKMVEELSGGKVGYVHVQGMNDASYRTVYEEVLGRNAEKDALIVDTRFNGGGWLHEDLSNFLNGKNYISFKPYGFSATGGEPQGKWYKPSCVLMSESNYSDAHTFPYAYRAKEIGKLIGMPVPGTSTSVWWETQIDPTMVFGIPMIGNYGVKEQRALENFQLEPDIKVTLPYKAFINGKDTQIEAAVKEMLKTIK
jgi:Tol biopolymer transport system component/C-terminal processing protease CtpA/Prc